MTLSDELNAALGALDTDLAALDLHTYDEAVSVINQGLRVRYLNKLNRHDTPDGMRAHFGTEINRRCDNFVAAHDATGWSNPKGLTLPN